MTISEIRSKYPSKDFLFYKNGMEAQGCPFLHQKVKDYKVKKNHVSIEL